MVKQRFVDSRWQTVPETTDVPVMARLPAVAPVERRNMAARYALLGRIYREFGDMPGLSVTPNQAAKLFGLAPEVALRILERLAEMRVLHQLCDGNFAARHFEDS
jgi:hypothetical protein